MAKRGIFFQFSLNPKTERDRKIIAWIESVPRWRRSKSVKDLLYRVLCGNLHSPPVAAGGDSRIERLFRTFQDRVIKEMRLEKIASIEEANRFLEKYLPIYNKRFEVAPQKPEDLHRTAPPARELDRILCIKSERVLRKDWTLSYEGKLYQIQENIRAEKICIEERLDGSLHLSHRGKSLRYTEILNRPVKVQPPSDKVNRPKSSKPAADHPWRDFQFGRKRKKELVSNP